MLKRKMLMVILVMGLMGVFKEGSMAADCNVQVRDDVNNDGRVMSSEYRETMYRNEGGSVCNYVTTASGDPIDICNINFGGLGNWKTKLTCNKNGSWSDNGSTQWCFDGGGANDLSATANAYNSDGAMGMTCSGLLPSSFKYGIGGGQKEVMVTDWACVDKTHYGKCMLTGPNTTAMTCVTSCGNGQICKVKNVDAPFNGSSTQRWYECISASCDNGKGGQVGLDVGICYQDAGTGRWSYKVCQEDGKMGGGKECGKEEECIAPGGVAKCVSKLNSNLCTETDTGDTNITHVDSGSETCDNKKQKRYSCDSPNKYTLVEDCGSKGEVCYQKKGETTTQCGKEGEIDKENVVDNRSNTIDTTGRMADVFCSGGSGDIQTALGCVPTEMSKFVPWLLSWLFGVAGGIAFLLMAYGFILIATSSGDEKKVQGARETITSAIIGLLVCIFAIFILRLIAVNILKIPGIN